MANSHRLRQIVGGDDGTDLVGEPLDLSQLSLKTSEDVVNDVRRLILDHRLDDANEIVGSLLGQRVASGDIELESVSLLLQHYQVLIARMPPLAHVGVVPLRPDERLYACFDQFIELIRLQQNQISELQAMVAELI